MAMHVLAYGAPCDLVVEYAHISRDLIIICMKIFAKVVIEFSEPESTQLNDATNVVDIGVVRGLPRILGSIDIACTQDEIITLWDGLGISLGIAMIQPSYSKIQRSMDLALLLRDVWISQ